MIEFPDSSLSPGGSHIPIWLPSDEYHLCLELAEEPLKKAKILLACAVRIRGIDNLWTICFVCKLVEQWEVFNQCWPTRLFNSRGGYKIMLYVIDELILEDPSYLSMKLIYWIGCSADFAHVIEKPNKNDMRFSSRVWTHGQQISLASCSSSTTTPLFENSISITVVNHPYL